MTATRPGTLLALAVGAALLGYLLAETAYGALPSLPLLAAFTIGVLAVVEGAMAKVVRDRLQRRRTGGRPLHPLQVFRAVVLAKASSTGGAVLVGAYGGLLAWTLPRRGELVSVDRDATAAAVSAAASLLLVVAALLLERSCRTPPEPGLGSRS